MGRKKKQSEENKVEEKEESSSFLHGDAKRSIGAVVLFALALLFILGFLGVAGPLGVAFDQGVGMIFGWGKWISPVVLALAGTFLLGRRPRGWSDAIRFVGLFMAFVGLLGFFHIFAFKQTEMFSAAQDGRGGGLIGALLAYMGVQLAGNVGGFIVLCVIFLIGVIAAFNVSLIHWIESGKLFFANTHKEDESLDVEENFSSEVSYSEPLIANDDGTEGLAGWEEDAGVVENSDRSEADALPAANIMNIRFADDVSQQQEDNTADMLVGQETRSNESVARRLAPAPKRKKIAWKLPPIDLVEGSQQGKDSVIRPDTDATALTIQRTLKDFDIDVELGAIQVGPTVTQYTFRPAVGVKLSRITTLNNDLAYALAAPSIRIEAPIPGKSLVGVEVPNKSLSQVRLKELLESREMTSHKNESLMFVLGRDVANEVVTTNLDKLPHLLIAGTTGSGKSVSINAMLLSWLYRNTPDDLQLILVDPKRVELTPYNHIPHLKTDVIVEAKKVVGVLKWAVSEMEHRYKLFEECMVRNIQSYREKRKAGGMRERTNPETNQTTSEPMESLPYIVIVIDEMADLMMAHGKEVETLIVRLAQMSRATGIHLVLATQRPSIEVITGLIKANITARVALQVATQVDSRTILDMGGAEKLLGKGDMLYLSPTSPLAKRLQGAFVSEDEVYRVTDFWRKQAREHETPIPETFGSDESSQMQHHEVASAGFGENRSGEIDFDALNPEDEDSKYGEAKQVVTETGRASTSFLQRRLSVGYSRAAKLLDMLEEAGIVGPAEGAKGRVVYVGPHAKGGQQGRLLYDDPTEDQEVRNKWTE